eukprot:CAMPEP_0179135034 /NCGR_PEP_ID=MMETSP0796-20121207/64277_1 /TAXON_ID=73915 /ORGANISM="Pyrodinium bahamense, Strain pbaha01" /LENGTH=102 /DNA_ID=CAMNT_0020834043 /DNA_START=498 /DNA_END=803 /DNA_ORIENTATION=-
MACELCTGPPAYRGAASRHCTTLPAWHPCSICQALQSAPLWADLKLRCRLPCPLSRPGHVEQRNCDHREEWEQPWRRAVRHVFTVFAAHADIVQFEAVVTLR